MEGRIRIRQLLFYAKCDDQHVRNGWLNVDMYNTERDWLRKEAGLIVVEDEEGKMKLKELYEILSLNI